MSLNTKEIIGDQLDRDGLLQNSPFSMALVPANQYKTTSVTL